MKLNKKLDKFCDLKAIFYLQGRIFLEINDLTGGIDM
ncbi:MAG: hypothetical protein JWQ66_1415 [Mucilaginibacter sp.]|nr:hypothetical protein [Mucilaginibacter sp.]